MDVILILRCVKRDKITEFLASYNAQQPNHPDFVRETLTQLNSSLVLPPALRSLPLGCNCEDCVTFLNIAEWRSAAAFAAAFNPQTTHDPTIECCDRLRLVLASRATHGEAFNTGEGIAAGRKNAAEVAEVELEAAEKELTYDLSSSVRERTEVRRNTAKTILDGIRALK